VIKKVKLNRLKTGPGLPKPVVSLPDCRHWTGELPCGPHKRFGVTCSSCRYYQPVQGRILLIKLGAAGDVLRSTSVLLSLRLKHPGAEIWWITRSESIPILVNNPNVDVVLPLEGSWTGVFATMKFEAAYGLDMDRQAASILMEARAKKRFGFGLDENGRVIPLTSAARTWFEMGLWDPLKRLNRKSYGEHLSEIVDVMHVSRPPILAFTEQEQSSAIQMAERVGFRRKGFRFGIHVGGGGRWTQKQWRPDGFLDLAKKIIREFPGSSVGVFGGPLEKDVLAFLSKKLKDQAVIFGPDLPYRSFAALWGLSDLVLTGDSLALHTALALGRRVVAYFGPTSSYEIDLYGLGEKVLPPGGCKCFYQKRCLEKISCMDRLSPMDLLNPIRRQWRIAVEQTGLPRAQSHG